MRITDGKYFEKYFDLIGNKIDSLIKAYNFSDESLNFDYQTQASAVYSSNIEGNSIDLNSYMNYKLSKKKYKPEKEFEEIENLILAYKYAQKNKLNEKNFLNTHKIFSKTLVIKKMQGKYRTEKIGVFDKGGLVYLAIEPEYVNESMKCFFNDIETLLDNKISNTHTFYFASLIHLVFAHIHPFRDGNGRAARLIEKWFLTEKLGKDFWTIPSERYYREHQQEYYQNINLGVNYYELNYDNCIPFLLMLPACLQK